MGIAKNEGKKVIEANIKPRRCGVLFISLEKERNNVDSCLAVSAHTSRILLQILELLIIQRL